MEELTETAAAELLARLLGDPDIWAAGSRPPADSAIREKLAAEAVAIYRLTGPIVEERMVFSKKRPYDSAVVEIRAIAERCAMLSYAWDKKQLRKWAFLPTRDRVETGISREGLDVWAAERGQPLVLERSTEIELRLMRMRARTNRRGIARSFSLVDDMYDKALGMRPGLRVWMASQPKLAEAGAGAIAATRNHLFFAGEVRDKAMYLVCEAMLMMAQGIFVATHEPRELPEIFPTKEFLRGYLHRTGGYAWLTKRLCEVPEWLAESQGEPAGGSPH